MSWGREGSVEPGGCRDGLGRGQCRDMTGTWAHLVQHGIALGPLPLPEQHQASDDVRWHDVQVSEKLGKEVGDFRVGVLCGPGRRRGAVAGSRREDRGRV